MEPRSDGGVSLTLVEYSVNSTCLSCPVRVDPPIPASPNSTHSFKTCMTLSRMMRHEEWSSTERAAKRTVTPHVPTSSETGNRWRSSSALMLNSGYIVLCLPGSVCTSPGWSAGSLLMAIRQSVERSPCPKLKRLQLTGIAPETEDAELWTGTATKAGMQCTCTETRQNARRAGRIPGAES